MATSGDSTLTVTLNDLILQAFEHLQVGADGETLAGDAQDRARRIFNFFLKSLESQGLHLWAYDEGTLFPTVGTYEYDFASARLTNTFYETTLSAAASSGASSIPVASDDNISDGDNIQIIKTDNTGFWTTVNGTPSGDTVSLDDNLDGAAASGAKVRNYSATDTFVPVSRIVSMRRRESATSEIPILLESRKRYFDQPNKTSTGTVLIGYYERRRTNGYLYVWQPPSSAVPLINFTYERLIEINNSDTEVDVPEYMFEMLTWNLAYRMIPSFGCSEKRAMMIKELADTSMNNALSFDQEMLPIQVKV